MAQQKKQRPARSRGRPKTRTAKMPERIPDTPENVARIFLTSPPKTEEEWRYLKKNEGEKPK